MARVYTDYDLAVIRRRQGEDIPLPPKPRKRKNDESRIQQGVIRWFAATHKQWGVAETLLFAIGNGGRRDAVTGAIMKREGVRAGVSDLMLAVPRGRFHGLFLEIKHETGRLRPEQETFIIAATRQGYAAYAAYGYDPAVKLITRYLNGEDLF